MLMLDNMPVSLGTLEKAVISRELTPILAELVTLGPGNDQHPTARQFFDWLVEPQRTGEEYTYVIGELADDVSMVMEEHFLKYVYQKGCHFLSSSMAAEALAMKCPILEGSWEQAAWTIVVSSQKSHSRSCASDCLSAWIIHVIGDPDLCPNPYLRIELMDLLIGTVDIDESNQTQVIESVLSACSSYNIDYATANIVEFHQTHVIESVLSAGSSFNIDYLTAQLLNFRKIELHNITRIFQMVAKYKNILEFDNKLAEKLLDVKESRCSAIVQNVRYLYAVTPARFTEPRELHGIIALLNTTAGLIQQIYKDMQKESCNLPSILKRINNLYYLFYIIITYFKASCQTPQLVCLTASCIMDAVWLVLQVSVDLYDDIHTGGNYISSLEKIAKLLRELFGDDNFPTRTPLGPEMYNNKRLSSIRDLFHSCVNCDYVVMIKTVFDNLCLYEI